MLARSGKLLAATALLFHFSASSQTKTIHLRSETISTQPRSVAPKRVQPQSPSSGLFLIQFDKAVTANERAELQTAGVELLKYVPDDAFIARFSNVTPDQLQTMPFVRWVGPYKPTHKVHPRLAALVQAPTQPENLRVNILIVPGATAQQIRAIRSSLLTIEHQSTLRQGTVLRATVDSGQLSALAQSDAVLWIERAPKRKLVDELASKLIGGDDGKTGTPTVTEQLGFGGQGVTVCVADTGLDTGDTNTMHADLRGRVSGFKPYGP